MDPNALLAIGLRPQPECDRWGGQMRMKQMLELALLVVCALSIVVPLAHAGAPNSSIATNQAADNPKPAYVAIITNGQVFIHLRTHPDSTSKIGPFIKKDEHRYVYETESQGTHHLTKATDGRWFYDWTYVQMRAELVDASSLEKTKASQQATPPYSAPAAREPHR